MEDALEWLSDNVCEVFANCDINMNTFQVEREPTQVSSGNFTMVTGGKTAAALSNSGVSYSQSSGTVNFLSSDSSFSVMNGFTPTHMTDSTNTHGYGNGEKLAYHSVERWNNSQTNKFNNNLDVKSSIESKETQETAADSTSFPESASYKKREQKRRPKPKDGTSLICQVCGDRALGYNFDAVTCESCKAFFRRNALKTKVFTCSFEGNCKLDQHTRKFCSGCRLKKCFDVGMKKDWILTDDQLAKRRKKSSRSLSSEEMKFCSPIEQGSLPSHFGSTGKFFPPHKMDVYSPSGSNSESDINSPSHFADSTESSSLDSSPMKFTPLPVKQETNEDDSLIPLTPEIEAEIRNLEKEYQSVFDSGYSEDQAKRMVEKPHNANDLFNMTDIFIRRLIKFSKHIPEFKMLKQEDQIHLLKGGIMEIMILRSTMGFDPTKHKWKVKQQQDMKEHNIDPSIIKEQLGTGMYTEHVKFVKTLHELTQSNNTIMTLMFVIEIFSPDRPNLVNVAAVTQAQDKFTKWLRMYLESVMRVSEAQALYPKLLMKLLDVRNLGESSAKLASRLDITKLEPLLIEVFSLQK